MNTFNNCTYISIYFLYRKTKGKETTVVSETVEETENMGLSRISVKGNSLVAGFNWGYDLTPIKNNPLNAEEIGYVSHPYPQKREKTREPK